MSTDAADVTLSVEATEAAAAKADAAKAAERPANITVEVSISKRTTASQRRDCIFVEYKTARDSLEFELMRLSL